MADSNSLEALMLAVDRKDSAAFVTFLTEDASFIFANNPAVTGREAIRVAVQVFFDSIKCLSHQVANRWTPEGVVICTGTVTYTRRDDSTLTVPFANVLKLSQAAISQYQIFVDISDLFPE